MVSPEDRELLKRRFPAEPRKEEEPIKQFVVDQSLLAANDARSGVGRDLQTPTWVTQYVNKLPSLGMKAARGDTVDAVMYRLLDWNIPEVNDILL